MEQDTEAGSHDAGFRADGSYTGAKYEQAQARTGGDKSKIKL